MMQILKTKSKASVVALILVLTVAAAIVALPTASAQPTKTTYAFIGAVPNPVGVGQEVLLHVGITDYLTIATDGWKDITVTVTRPDNTTETLGPYTTDSTGGTGAVYVPSQVGTYYLQTNFPEQVYNWTTPPIFDPSFIGPVRYLASTSEKLALVVQQDPVEFYPGSPLPTEYWSHPIDAQHREWSVISGNWLESDRPPNHLAPYNDGPETAHILWAKPLTQGGIAGGEVDSHAYDCGDAYRGKWNSPVIINGRLFYNRFPSTFTGPLNPQQGIVAVDLRTGEELWFKNNTILSFGQVMYWSSMNMHGAFAYLWVTESIFDPVTFTFVENWHAYDPFTGEWVYTMTNMPSSGEAFGASVRRRGPDGEFLIYTVDQANGWMTVWNSSNIPALYGSPEPGPDFGFTYYSWMPGGKIVNATGPCAVLPQTPLGLSGYMWNVSIPTGLPGGVSAVLEDRIIGTNIGVIGDVAPPTLVFWAISTKPGQEGTLLFNRTWTTPPGQQVIMFGDASLEEGVFTLWAKETRAHYGFSTDTGAPLWGPTPSQHYLDIYYATTNALAYGNLYSAGAAGILYCYDAETGNLEWTYEANDPYTEILWANNWWLVPLFITDGKIYLTHEEHSVIDPKPRGAPFICIDAETGDEVFRIDGAFRGTHWGGNPIIGDSIIASYSTYDQRIYAIGKGPSATTVTASPKVSAHGSSVVIEGTVTDVSAGTKNHAIAARFPNGVPAIADADMSDWMKYVYLQFAVPMDVTGVLVTLDAVDPNGNFISIGTTTSDMSGTFSYMWTPEHEGKYTIIATFPGSAAYYASYAQTAIGVDPAPPEPVTPAVQEDIDQSAENLMNSLTPILYGIVAAIVIVAVLVVYTLWTVRKQK